MPSRSQTTVSAICSSVLASAIAAAISPSVWPWLTIAGILLALVLWNWMLTLALAIALTTGVIVYLTQERRLNLKWFRQSRAWKHHRSLWVALLTGVGGFSVTYGAVHLWQDAALPWPTLASFLQGIGTVSILGILVWDKVRGTHLGKAREDDWGTQLNTGLGKEQNNGRNKTLRPSSSNRSPQTLSPPTTPKRPFQDLLDDLTHSNAVARLIAVRQIALWAIASPAQVPANSLPDDVIVWSAADIRQCLQLMRKHEPELAVQQAIDEAIARITPTLQPTPSDSFHQDFYQAYPSSLPPMSPDSVLAIPNLMRTRAEV